MGGSTADENTPFHPRSPYAVAKAAAYWEVANYREAYDLFVCSGILFNHESPLRPERFVTKKIISSACKIAETGKGNIRLGNMDIKRDWGWAPEYVEAMWLMLQQDKPDDFVIATGETNSLQDFAATAFASVGLNWQNHVESDSSLFRPTDLAESKGNPQKALEVLGWEAQYKMRDVVKKMMGICP